MPTQIKIEIDDASREVMRSVERLPEKTGKAICRAMDVVNLESVSITQRRYLSFPSDEPPTPIGCRFITGRLRQTVRPSLARVVDNTRVESSIGSNVKYAAAQEFGATIPAHTIYPKPGNKALKFQIGDRVVFAKSVKFPGATIPARHPIQSGIRDNLPRYNSAISKAILESWNKP